MEGFWPQKAWYFAAEGHEARLGDEDGTISNLGLGWHSGSHIAGGAIYVRAGETFDPSGYERVIRISEDGSSRVE